MLRRSRSFGSFPSRAEVEAENEADEEEEGEDGSVMNEFENQERYSILRWYPGKNRKPMVNFSAACVLVGTPEHCMEEIKSYRLGYKFVKTECKLVRNMLACHGFKENNPNSTNFNVMWTGTHLKPYTLRALSEYQKVNHFPRSYELTRKDRLYKNIQRMQHAKGVRYFDFIPQSFVLPSELNDFYAAFLKDRGPWIVKPCASSRGRGIYLINHTNQIPLDETVLVCRYISNPLLINGYKFDCRIYVAVTSYDPLRLYIYEEGLARFSTVKYEKSSNNLHNQWMHLTNYSVNKMSDDYVRCDDPEVDDYGSKWSFSAMLRCLKEAGKDTEALMARIEDVIIKTIISGEMTIATACKMFVPHRGNCFELFGFDILVDENLKPWLLEVNLSPSLACDSPLDLKIKANLMSDLFNLTGIIADDPTLKKPPKLLADQKKKQRYGTATYSSSELKILAAKSINKVNDGLSNEERRILRNTKEEYKRRGNFIRVYPSPESWELYASLQEHQTSFNRIIHSKLFPELWRSSARPQSATYIARARNFSAINRVTHSEALESSATNGHNFHQRYVQYERKLPAWSSFHQTQSVPEGTNIISSSKPSLQQGQLLDTGKLVYERNLLSTSVEKKRNYGQIRVKEVVNKGPYLNKFQAREAFAAYLQRVQYRLLQEISLSHENPGERLNMEDIEKQEQQISLIQRFLTKAAVNLSNPINIINPHKNLPILERKKILARQLNDFVRLYSRETELLNNRENADHLADEFHGQEAVTSETFSLFLSVARESELEEILTLYTRHNKSASIFLGAKSASTSTEQKKTGREADTRSSQGAKLSLRKTQSDTTVASELSRPKSGQVKLKETESSKRPPSGKNKLLRPISSNSLESRPRILSAGSKVGIARQAESSTRLHQRHATADGHARSSSAGSRRSDSSKLRLRMSTVCAYTGATDILKHRNGHDIDQHKRDAFCPPSRSSSRPRSSSSTKHVFGADDPRLQNALRKLSVKQAERTYSSNNIKPSVSIRTRKPTENRLYNDFESEYSSDDDNCDHVTSDRERFVRNSDEKFYTDRNNFQHQTASTQTVETCVSKSNSRRTVFSAKQSEGTVYGDPHPPTHKKPVIKNQLSSHRMNRLVGKK